MLPDRFDEPGSRDWEITVALCGCKPWRRGEAGGCEPFLGEDLVRGEQNRLYTRTGIWNLHCFEKGGDDVDQSPLADQRLDEIKDDRRGEGDKCPGSLCQIQRDRHSDRLMAQFGKTF
jgi:hypothetical protein